MQNPAKLNIAEVIDNAKFSRFQVGVLVLCGICLMMDGFDVQAMGYVGPVLKPEWHISDPEFGRVLSAALKGVLVGSLFLSMLADKFGRRPILIGSSIFFSITTIITARATSIDQLLWIRFIAGIGLGAIMPNAMALVSEYCPRRSRVMWMMIVSNGFTAGAAIGGFVAAWLLPHYGWRSVFYFGGTLPLITGVLMIFLLPESLQFLVLQGKNLSKVAAALKRIEPTVPDGVSYVIPEQRRQGFTFVNLFRDGRAVGTILLWITYFMNLLNLYFLQGWLPTVAKTAGFSTTDSVLIGTMNQVGGCIGAFALGWLVKRSGFVPVLATCFLVACVDIAMIGQPGMTKPLMFLVVFIAGFGITGGQAGVNAMTGTYYPTDLRSTGLGAGLGIGRIGSIVGPEVAGIMLGRKWSNQDLFYAASIPALIAALVMIAMRGVLHKPQRQPVPATAALTAER